MNAIGKIVVMFISFFVLSTIFWFINLEMNGTNKINPLGVVTIIGFSWFISYSKWANDNIWNRKTNEHNNTSDTSLNEVVEAIEEPIDNNHDILSNINLPSLSTKEEDDKETLLKIEELKKQIESLLESKENLENSLKEDVLSLVDRQRIAEEKYFAEIRSKNVIVVLLFMIMIAGAAAYAGLL